MTHRTLETIPVTWSDEHDGAFFALVRDLFPPTFTSGATALLSSYDEDSGPCPGPVVRAAEQDQVLAPSAPATGA